jgi:hypothetical protein
MQLAAPSCLAAADEKEKRVRSRSCLNDAETASAPPDYSFVYSSSIIRCTLCGQEVGTNYFLFSFPWSLQTFLSTCPTWSAFHLIFLIDYAQQTNIWIDVCDLRTDHNSRRARLPTSLSSHMPFPPSKNHVCHYIAPPFPCLSIHANSDCTLQSKNETGCKIVTKYAGQGKSPISSFQFHIHVAHFLIWNVYDPGHIVNSKRVQTYSIRRLGRSTRSKRGTGATPIKASFQLKNNHRVQHHRHPRWELVNSKSLLIFIEAKMGDKRHKSLYWSWMFKAPPEVQNLYHRWRSGEDEIK